MRLPFNSGLKQNILRLPMSSLRLPLLYTTLGILFITLGYIDSIVTNPAWEHVLDYTPNLGHIFIAFAILRFIFNLTVLSLKRLETQLYEKHRIASLILSSLRQGLRIIYYLAAINIVITLFEPTKFYLNFANSIINTVIILAIGWMAIQVVNTIEAVIYQQFANHHHKNKELNALYTKTRILKNIATVVIALISLAAILMSFSSVRSIGVSILASAGFFTAIIGLAMQKTLSSLFSGLQIAVSKLIQIGDVVVLENQTGVVEEISFTYIIMKCSDKRRFIVPISQFIDKPFENWSHEHHGLQNSIYLNLDYRIPVEAIRSHFISILEASPYWNKQTKKCSVSDFGEQTVKIRLQMSAVHVDALSDLLAEVREKMLAFLQEQYPRYIEIDRS